jgi:hypothetical protein
VLLRAQHGERPEPLRLGFGNIFGKMTALLTIS